MRNKLGLAVMMIATAVVFANCAKGIDPPVPTDMVSITGGEFIFGETQVCTTTAQGVCLSNQPWPSAKVKVSDFKIDKHEVTNFQYKHCVAKGKCPEPSSDGTGGTQTDVTLFPYYDSDKFKEFPMVNVTHAMAVAYCQFAGKRLPTELEWEYVILLANDSDKKNENRPRYIWGSNPDGCKGKLVTTRFCDDSVNEPKKVMSSSFDKVTINGADVFDLVGNVEEWTANTYLEAVTCKTELKFSSDISTGGCPDFFECTNRFQQGSNEWEDCMRRAVNCDQCKVDGNDVCFRVSGIQDCCPQIDGNSDTCRPVCIPYGPSEVVQDNSTTTFREGPDSNVAVVKGASYIASNECQMRLTRRRGVAKDQPAKNLGFRCASN